MRILKPQALGALTRVFEHDRKCWLACAAILPFSFDGALWSEAELWNVASDTAGAVPLDLCLPKARSEWFVAGRAFAPNGTAVRAIDVRVTMGTTSKRLRVIGDRVWNAGRPTEPEPFVEMPIDTTRAYGGAAFGENPAGKGYVGTFESPEGKPLPNIEEPDRLITSPSHRREPAGFGPQGLSSRGRLGKAGTYDAEWFAHQFPGVARDVDWSMFNLAPTDQQSKDDFRGDEDFTFENMHAHEATVGGRLPAVAFRVFMRKQASSELVELPVRLDTVWLFPNVKRGALIGRALAHVLEDDAADVDWLVVAAENRGQRRSPPHYAAVLDAYVAAPRGDAIPEKELLPTAVAQQLGTLPSPPVDPLRENMRNRVARELARVRGLLANNGVDPSKIAVQPPATSFAAFASEAGTFEERMQTVRRLTAEKRAEAERALAGAYERAHVDPIDKRASAKPSFSAQKALATLASAAQQARGAGHPSDALEGLLTNESLKTRLEGAEKRAREAYVDNAHRFDAQRPRSRADSENLRAMLEAARGANRSFAAADLAGADLSGLDLRGFDFREALLDGASLANCRLEGAMFTRAVLAHADVRGANLAGCNFRGANLGRARLSDVVASDADLSEAILAGADLSRANFQGATLERANLDEATVAEVDFTNAKLDAISFVNTSLKGARFVAASLVGAVLRQVDARGVDFSDASLRGVSFVAVDAERTVFRRATLEAARATEGSSFVGGVFEQANASSANFRGAALREADFTRADVRRADFSEADVRGGRFYRAIANEARFIRTNLDTASFVAANLMMAILQKASLRGADFKGANLFRADLARILVDTATSWKDAVLEQARVRPGAAS